MFRKFAEFESVRQVHLWLRQEGVRLPSVEANGDGRRVVWKLPVYKTVHRLLTNPIYGGAYAFGRTGSRVTVENGRKRVRRGLAREREQWDVLIVDHHEGYVSWAEYERNQRVIADNASRQGLLTRGAVRRGDALLAGLLRCGHCGRRIHVAYSGTKGECVRYSCRGAHLNHGTGWCIAFGGVRVDAAVATEVLRLLNPLGIEAALKAVAMREQQHTDRRHHAKLALTQARYEADLARRQYDAIDPANRLVAAELERRWNDRLAPAFGQEHPPALSVAAHACGFSHEATPVDSEAKTPPAGSRVSARMPVNTGRAWFTELAVIGRGLFWNRRLRHWGPPIGLMIVTDGAERSPSYESVLVESSSWWLGTGSSSWAVGKSGVGTGGKSGGAVTPRSTMSSSIVGKSDAFTPRSLINNSKTTGKNCAICASCERRWTHNQNNRVFTPSCASGGVASFTVAASSASSSTARFRSAASEVPLASASVRSKRLTRARNPGF